MQHSKSVNHLALRRVEGTFSCFSHKETFAGVVSLDKSFQSIPTLSCVHSVLKEAEPGPQMRAFTRSAAVCSALITQTSPKASSGGSGFSWE